MKRRALRGRTKPFLKWLGGKARLAETIVTAANLNDPNVTEYIEPFVGAGAVLWRVLDEFEPTKVVVGDISPELINVYTVVRDNVDALINALKPIDDEHRLATLDVRKQLYYDRRADFNLIKGKNTDPVREAALMIYLNKTGFNGVYRVNAKGEFNVPLDIHKKNVTICDEAVLKRCSTMLQGVTLECADYRDLLAKHASVHAWVYLDPPYRALRDTSFTAYTEGRFNASEQDALNDVVNGLTSAKVHVTLSNSDPTNVDVGDRYFENAFPADAGYTITALRSRHVVGRNGSSRTPLRELMITNF